MKDLKQFIKETIRECLNEAHEGKFDDDYDFTKHNFNTGDCDIYAISLHRLYEYPLYAIRGKYLDPDWGDDDDWGYEYCHIMVKLPNGNFMDSNGEQTKEEMISRAAFAEDIEEIEIVKITEEEAINMFSCEDQEKDIQKVMKYIINKTK